jgi:hypothetical protein|tara:strand:+ start:525 stop:698 length:174 start_codon:yes stop_codon:yes gene_type:complete
MFQNLLSIYFITHVATGKEITLEQKGFNRNELLQEASEKLETDFDKNVYGQYIIQPK